MMLGKLNNTSARLLGSAGQSALVTERRDLRRPDIASALQRPWLKAFLLPFGAPGRLDELVARADVRETGMTSRPGADARYFQ
jgi:hypothetical protein